MIVGYGWFTKYHDTLAHGQGGICAFGRSRRVDFTAKVIGEKHWQSIQAMQLHSRGVPILASAEHSPTF